MPKGAAGGKTDEVGAHRLASHHGLRCRVGRTPCKLEPEQQELDEAAWERFEQADVVYFERIEADDVEGLEPETWPEELREQVAAVAEPMGLSWEQLSSGRPAEGVALLARRGETRAVLGIVRQPSGLDEVRAAEFGYRERPPQPHPVLLLALNPEAGAISEGVLLLARGGAGDVQGEHGFLRSRWRKRDEDQTLIADAAFFPDGLIVSGVYFDGPHLGDEDGFEKALDRLTASIRVATISEFASAGGLESISARR